MRWNKSDLVQGNPETMREAWGTCVIAHADDRRDAAKFATTSKCKELEG
jgi:hypothetical protein